MKVIQATLPRDRHNTIMLFNRAVNIHSVRQPLEMNRFERAFDYFCNKMDGYKPVFLTRTDKATGKTSFLRDDRGRKLINWVKKTVNDGVEVTETLFWRGGRGMKATDIATGKTLEKTFDNSTTHIMSEFKDGKPAFMVMQENTAQNYRLVKIRHRFWDMLNGKKGEVVDKLKWSKETSGMDDTMRATLQNFEQEHNMHSRFSRYVD